MTRNKFFVGTILLLTSLTLCTCTKDTVSNSFDQTFCSAVDGENFEETGILINDFLALQKDGTEDEKLEDLQEWLEKNSCVAQAEIICNSCIYTLPPQSEISVDYISNGQTITMTFDILMADPLKFNGYH